MITWLNNDQGILVTVRPGLSSISRWTSRIPLTTWQTPSLSQTL